MTNPKPTNSYDTIVDDVNVRVNYWDKINPFYTTNDRDEVNPDVGGFTFEIGDDIISAYVHEYDIIFDDSDYHSDNYVKYINEADLHKKLIARAIELHKQG